MLQLGGSSCRLGGKKVLLPSPLRWEMRSWKSKDSSVKNCTGATQLDQVTVTAEAAQQLQATWFKRPAWIHVPVLALVYV